jgi:hypothetical protein
VTLSADATLLPLGNGHRQDLAYLPPYSRFARET